MIVDVESTIIFDCYRKDIINDVNNIFPQLIDMSVAERELKFRELVIERAFNYTYWIKKDINTVEFDKIESDLNKKFILFAHDHFEKKITELLVKYQQQLLPKIPPPIPPQSSWLDQCSYSK